MEEVPAPCVSLSLPVVTKYLHVFVEKRPKFVYVKFFAVLHIIPMAFWYINWLHCLFCWRLYREMRGDSQVHPMIAETSYPLFANNSIYTRPQVCS